MDSLSLRLWALTHLVTSKFLPDLGAPQCSLESLLVIAFSGPPLTREVTLSPPPAQLLVQAHFCLPLYGCCLMLTTTQGISVVILPKVPMRNCRA
jgi:hypothetical protein